MNDHGGKTTKKRAAAVVYGEKALAIEIRCAGLPSPEVPSGGPPTGWTAARFLRQR
ncbi:MAG TPA: hypothetical protein VE476_09935 [Propionibacteriaceae bacterium]|nr:hypothetical protein [Propionibacteriaceae bacterium]